MKLEDLMGYVINKLYEGLTGGTADLPLPANMKLNFLSPGMPIDESFFDFAIAGPYAGPTQLNLEDFRELVETLSGPKENDDPDAGDAEARPMGMSPQDALEEAKRMYQQHLLGCWEQWSRLVDFIPVSEPAPSDTGWAADQSAGKHKHISVVYGQSNRKLSTVYKDTLKLCKVADDALTPQEKALLERMQALLTIQVEVEDFLTGKKTMEPRPSPAMEAYMKYKQAYEEAAIDYASRLARASSGTAADAIEWQRSGGIYRQRALQAQSAWTARGYKNDIERAQAAISHITGQSMVLWKDMLLQTVLDLENSTTGAYGYSFSPASIIPGAFARSSGWSHFSERSLKRTVERSSSSSSGGGQFGLSLGAFTIGGGGGGGKTTKTFNFDSSDFGIEFEYTTVEIARFAFEPSFFMSRGWKPNDTFVRDYKTDKHSDGTSNPNGALIGYPTKALFLRNLRIYSSDIVKYMKSQESTAQGGGLVGIGPFVIGGRYQQANRSSKSNYEYDGASIKVNGMQLLGFMSALFPKTADPSPDIKNWI